MLLPANATTDERQAIAKEEALVAGKLRSIRVVLVERADELARKGEIAQAQACMAGIETAERLLKT